MKCGRSTLHRTRTFWVLVLLIAIGCTAAAVYPGRAGARLQFQSPLSPVSPASTPSSTPAPSAEASETPTTEAEPTSLVPVFTPLATLAPPTLFPSPLPTRTTTLPSTATATPTPISPAEKTATAAAKSFLPPPTLTSPGLLPPLAPAQLTPLSGPTLTPLPPHDDSSTSRPTPSSQGIFQFLDNNLVVLGVAGICWSVLAIGALAVAAVWMLRKRS